MYIDTHLHLGKNIGIDPKDFIKNAYEANVKCLIVSGCELETLDETISYLDYDSNIYACLGFHPECVGKIGDLELLLLENKVLLNKKVIAIGEIGLDYHYDATTKSEQIILFEKQLDLAQKLNLPVFIHTRDAINDTYNILKKYKIKGIIHSFSGSLEMAEKFIDLGYLLGINGVVTFKNSNLYKVIEKIPLEKIVLETDSPYLAPDPFRGTINESKNIPIIAEKIASIKGITADEVQEITTKNVTSLFDLTLNV